VQLGEDALEVSLYGALLTIARFGDNRHFGLSSDDCPESLEDDGVIVGEKNANYPAFVDQPRAFYSASTL
jgi:hypothetical protein